MGYLHLFLCEPMVKGSWGAVSATGQGLAVQHLAGRAPGIRFLLILCEITCFLTWYARLGSSRPHV